MDTIDEAKSEPTRDDIDAFNQALAELSAEVEDNGRGGGGGGGGGGSTAAGPRRDIGPRTGYA